MKEIRVQMFCQKCKKEVFPKDVDVRDFMMTGVCTACKKESETITLKENGFINDLDGGPIFWPQFITSDTILVSYIDAYQFLNYLNKKSDDSTESTNNEESGQLKTLKKQLTETSNPVIMIVK